MPFISVIVPTFNRVAALARCLDALRAQTLPRAQYELIVVDDGSMDGTSDWLGQQGDVCVVRTAHRGAAAARNAGARAALGDALAFTDDDCVAPSDWLCCMSDALNGYDVVGGRIVNAARDNVFAATAQVILDALMDELNANLRNGGMLTSNNIAYRRAAFETAGGFDERYTVGGEERDLNYRLWRSGARLCFAPHVVVQHHASPTMRQFLAQQFAYGRGAYRFYHQTPPPARLPLAFYRRLSARAHGPAQLACLFLSQCAVVCGYLSLAMRWTRD
ncbi:MAG: glycosyltransferase [Chloroflexota bacterium]